MLTVLEPGLFTLVVDHGRTRTRSLGVPVGGAADRLSLALGNGLVGNPPDTSALEITLVGPTLKADTPLGCVLYGAPFALRGDQHGGLHVGTTFTLAAGETLTVGGTHLGMRAYLCVPGGFRGKEILGSRSSLGPVIADQQLDCDASQISARFLPPEVPGKFDSTANEPRSLRVVAGAQADWFRPGLLLERQFEVTPASNRMGLRLRGEPLDFAAGVREMVSEPVSPGAVQVTRDGQCIILGIDGQTIGGYPKIAHVIAADLDRLGQLRPGQRLRFVEVSQEEARAAFRRQQEELSTWQTRLSVGI